MKACYAVSLTFIAAKINCCYKTTAKLVYTDTLNVGKAVPEEEKLELYQRKC